MLPIRFNESTDLLSVYKNDFLKSVTEKFIMTLKSDLPKPGVRSLYYYPEENTLLITHLYSSWVHLINLGTGNIRHFDHHTKTVRSVSVYNNEIITASWDRTICVVDFYTLELRLILTEPEMGRSPHAIAARLKDGNYVFAVSYDSDLNPQWRMNCVRKWSLENGQLETVITRTGEHISMLSSGECQVHQGMLYVISDSGFLNIFNAESGEFIKENQVNNCLRSLMIVPEFQTLLVTDQDGSIHCFDLVRMEFTKSVSVHESDIISIIQSPLKPDIIITSSFDGTVKILRMPSLEVVSTLQTSSHSLWTSVLKGNTLITGGFDNDIRVFDISIPEECRFLGRMMVFEDSYAVCPAESQLFYTNDLSNFEVLSLEGNVPLQGKNAEYLLNSGNTLTALYRVFGLPCYALRFTGQSREFTPLLNENYPE